MLIREHMLRLLATLAGLAGQAVAPAPDPTADTAGNCGTFGEGSKALLESPAPHLSRAAAERLRGTVVLH